MTSSACPPSTTSDCETYCSNAGGFMLNYSCSMLCDGAQKLADDSGCDATYSAFMSCAAAVADGGAVWAGDACVAARNAFVQCLAPFCAKPPNTTECESSIPLTGN